MSKQFKLFEEDRMYQPCDPIIIALLGGKSTQAQMRHHKRGPAYFKLGKKIIMHGHDLNLWANANRVETFGCSESLSGAVK